MLWGLREVLSYETKKNISDGGFWLRKKLDW